MKTPEKPKEKGVVNRAQLAALMSISLPTVDSWVARGCPVEQTGDRGRSYSFKLADVVGWRIKDERRQQGLAGMAGDASITDPVHNPLRRLCSDAVESFLHLAYGRGLVEGMVEDLTKLGCEHAAATRFVLGIYQTQRIVLDEWTATDHFDKELGGMMDRTVSRGNPGLPLIPGPLPVEEQHQVAPGIEAL